MTTTLKYIIFFVLFGLVLTQFLPLVTEMPFDADLHIATGMAMMRKILVCVPPLQVGLDIFMLSLQLVFYYAIFRIVMFFLTRGKGTTL